MCSPVQSCSRCKDQTFCSGLFSALGTLRWGSKGHAGIHFAELRRQGALQECVDDPLRALPKSRQALCKEAIPIVWKELFDG